MSDIVLDSVLTCPHCGQASTERMPTDFYQIYYQCNHCKHLLRPQADECCVYCSYGSVKCPMVQAQARCSH
jgi:phage terminase large subunit GpA-like protein